MKKEHNSYCKIAPLSTVCFSTVFNECNDTKMTRFLTLWKHYLQLFFIVFNVFKGMGKWTRVTGERNNLEV